MSIFSMIKRTGEKQARLLLAGSVIAVVSAAFLINGNIAAYAGDQQEGGPGVPKETVTYTNDAEIPFDNPGLPAKGTLKMCKYYRYVDEISGTVTEISYYCQGTGGSIQIQEERQSNGFELKEWFTSTDGWGPEDQQDPSIYNWENVVKTHADGTYKGTEEQLLEISQSDPDNVLHLLYEFEGFGDSQPPY